MLKNVVFCWHTLWEAPTAIPKRLYSGGRTPKVMPNRRIECRHGSQLLLCPVDLHADLCSPTLSTSRTHVKSNRLLKTSAFGKLCFAPRRKLPASSAIRTCIKPN